MLIFCVWLFFLFFGSYRFTAILCQAQYLTLFLKKKKKITELKPKLYAICSYNIKDNTSK